MKKIIKTLSVAFGLCLLVMSVSVAFAGEELMLKDVDSTNYDQYIKPVRAAYGYNKGECNRQYLPHEEHFYSEYYDHWNVDVVYDGALIKKLYTDFEKARPTIEHVDRTDGGVCLRWKSVEGAEKYVISVRRDGAGWNVLDIVDGGNFSYVDRAMIEKGTSCEYRVRGIKHVRLWDVKTECSETADITI